MRKYVCEYCESVNDTVTLPCVGCGRVEPSRVAVDDVSEVDLRPTEVEVLPDGRRMQKWDIKIRRS